MLQITSMIQTMKALELDKADLYQKMVSSDRMIRQEMSDKFAKEKVIMEESWIAEKMREMHDFEVSSRAEQRIEIEQVIEELRIKHLFETKTVADDNRLKVEGFLAEMEEKNSSLKTLQQTIDELQQKYIDVVEAHEHKMAELLDSKQKEIAELKTQWDSASNAREKLFKVQSAVLQSNLEKKHAFTTNQLQEDHKLQIITLEEQNAQSLVLLQKESDMIKSLEIQRIYQAHKDEIEELQNTHQLNLGALQIKFNTDLDVAFAELVTDYDGQLKEHNDKINSLENNALNQLVTII